MQRFELSKIYDRLLTEYGPQEWWPAESPFEVMVGAVLVQATAWANAALAIENLRSADALSPPAIRSLPSDELERLIRPSGFFRSKARKLAALCEFLGSRYSDDIDEMARQPIETLRVELLEVHGVGEETADDILLYALGHPVFVIDAFTRRVFGRLGLVDSAGTYQSVQNVFNQHLPADESMFNEFHALIVRHANSTCKRSPSCMMCPLSSRCPKVGV